MLKKGDIIELKHGHQVYTDIQTVYGLVRTEIIISNAAAYLAGRYIVYKTATEGGGTAHGPHDRFPDGHHVYCHRLDDESIKVDFYQSGCFTAMITDIEPIQPNEQHTVIPRVTGRVSYDVRVQCPHCKSHLQLNEYPYNDEETDYSLAEDEIGAALFGYTDKPAKWEGIDIEYECCGCHGKFSVSGFEI